MATAPKPPPLTTRMQRLLALDGPFFGRPRPTPAEMESLLGVLAEGSRAAGRVHLGRAIQIAADNAPDDRTAGLIARVLKDINARPALRLQAAASLGDIPVRAAGKALAEALTQSDAGLEATLLQSLAKVGELDAEHLIQQRPAADSPRLAQLRSYARAAILLRAGKPLDPAAAEAVLPTGTPLALTAEPPQSVATALAHFRGARYGVQFSPDLGWRLQADCGEFLLLLAAQMAPGQRLVWLAGGARIAGVLAVRANRREGSWAVHRLVLTQPGPGGTRVSVLRPDGEVELLGDLAPSRGGLTLTLRSTARAALPVAVDGVVGDDVLRLQVRAFAAQRARKRSGEVDPATL